MNQFEQLIGLYQQLINLADETKSLIDVEEYNEAILKLNYKDSLISKFSGMKKNMVFNEEQKKQVNIIEQILKEKEEANIELLSGLRLDVVAELKKVNNHLKVNNAYSRSMNKGQGSIVDILE